MTPSPNSPRILKGAIVGIDPFNPVASVIVFQYNPDSMTRTLQPQSSGGEGSVLETQRLKGAPVETIKMDIEIDVVDQREQKETIEETSGIFPQLAALEMLVYPKTLQLLLNLGFLAAGRIEIVPPAGPLTLLIWGLKRMLPVKITEFSITEEAFDSKLNPLRAKASLGLRVLSYNDLSVTHPGYYLFVYHQSLKETMATIWSANNLSNLGNQFTKFI